MPQSHGDSDSGVQEEKTWSVVSDEMDLNLRLNGDAIPLVGDNDYILNVLTSEDEPAQVSQVSLTPWMPDHGHGSDRDPEITEMEEGQFSVTNVSFTMPGFWELRFSFSFNGHEDNATFEIDVQ